MSELLQHGIAAARAGNRAEARRLLTQVIQADERNEQGWLWLSGVVDDPEDIRTCLHNVLDLNPVNPQARQGLAWVDAKYGPPAQAPATPIAPATNAPPASPYAPLANAPASYSGPTTRLAPEPATVSAPTISPASQPAENQCPFCGTPTTLAQKNCTQCRQSLMIRSAPAEKRSMALTILGGLLIFYGAITVLGGILGTLGALALGQPSAPAARAGAQAGSSFSAVLLIPIVFGVLFGVLFIRIGRALHRRQRWAYFAVIGLSALSLIGLLCNIAQVGGMIVGLAGGGAGLSPAMRQNMRGLTTAASAIVFVAILFQLVYFLLVGLSYRDFFGPLVRFQPMVEATDAVTHYNNGIAYKNRGMWYMAVQEWCAASRKKPQDKIYLQALGLAYAQIKKLYPFSSAYLHEPEQFLGSRKAELYTLAPDLEQIKLLG